MDYSPSETMKKIEQLALQQGKSVRSVLERSGLSRSTVTVARDRESWIRVDSLAKIADELGCSVDYLLGRGKNDKDFSRDETQILDGIKDLSVYDKARIVRFIETKLNPTQQ